MNTLHLVVSPPPHVPTAPTTIAAFRPQAPVRFQSANAPQAAVPPPTRTTTSPSPLDGTGGGLGPRGQESLEQLQQRVRAQTATLEWLRAVGERSASYGVSSGVSLPGAQVRPAGGMSSFGGEPSTRPVAPASTTTSPTVTAPERATVNLDALHIGHSTANPLFPRPDTSARRRELLDELHQLDQEEGLPAAPLHISQPTIPSNSAVYLLQDRFGRPHSLLIGPSGSARSLRSITRRLSTNPHPRYNPDLWPNGALPPPQIPPPELRRHIYAAIPRPPRINLPHLLRDRAAHFWLALKLAVFVVLFTGNGDWRRTLYLGSIAVVIFVWQTGILNDVLRPLVEAVYPPPPAPLIDDPQEQQQQQQQPPNPVNTAQLLINRQEDRVREVVRNAERCVMIFMASLVPGWHDRHVRAIEQQQEEVRLRDRELREEREREREGREHQGEQPQPAEARGAEVVEGVL